MTTQYREYIDFEGNPVLRDDHGDPPPGKPDAASLKRADQLAYGHKTEQMWGWEYRSTLTDAPPAGDGWELNTYVTDRDRTYWRRRKP